MNFFRVLQDLSESLLNEMFSNCNPICPYPAQKYPSPLPSPPLQWNPVWGGRATQCVYYSLVMYYKGVYGELCIDFTQLWVNRQIYTPPLKDHFPYLCPAHVSWLSYKASGKLQGNQWWPLPNLSHQKWPGLGKPKPVLLMAAKTGITCLLLKRAKKGLLAVLKLLCIHAMETTTSLGPTYWCPE